MLESAHEKRVMWSEVNNDAKVSHNNNTKARFQSIEVHSNMSFVKCWLVICNMIVYTDDGFLMILDEYSLMRCINFFLTS